MDIYEKSRNAIDFFVDFPWFRWYVNVAGDVIDGYINTEDWLLYGILLGALLIFS